MVDYLPRRCLDNPYSNMHIKLRIFRSNVKSVLVYGLETWHVTKLNTNKIQTFVNGCLQRVLRLEWYGNRVADMWVGSE
uniref:DUF6451 domain-containing protein n=1 Tax=Arion vulgaris TaxID=1028688 RepID=A0A0B7BQD7_9EUPU